MIPDGNENVDAVAVFGFVLCFTIFAALYAAVELVNRQRKG